jgi:hypothetical protein
MFPIKIPFLDAKEKMAKSIVAGRIRSIGQKEGIPVENIYAAFDVTSPDADFRIILYNKADMSKPVRELALSELL